MKTLRRSAESSSRRLPGLALPDRGEMPVPTIADIDAEGRLEIIASLKDGIDRERQVLVCAVPGSSTTACTGPNKDAVLRASTQTTAGMAVMGHAQSHGESRTF
jgi:hypothetical protein